MLRRRYRESALRAKKKPRLAQLTAMFSTNVYRE